jgi:catechol 2,3-dioxygenase-like lactoylglutathione lyase family enzyme
VTRRETSFVTAIDHVQLAMPPGREAEARRFYAGLLGLPERTKPPALAARGGARFESASVKIHLGVEADFRPARKAHPALLVHDLRALVAVLRAGGHEVAEDRSTGVTACTSTTRSAIGSCSSRASDDESRRRTQRPHDPGGWSLQVGHWR